MKRSHKLLALVAVAVTTLIMTASPALAQDVYYDDSIPAFFWCCYGLAALFGLAILVLFVWMLIDAIQRQEYEFPNSSGNSKMIWIVVLLVSLVVGFSWAAAPAYYFMVYRKVKRGTVQPPGGGYGGPPGGAGMAPPPPSAGAGMPPQPPAGGGTPPPPPQGGGTPPPPPPAQ